MGRHRHITCVRSDGLSAILRPLLDDRRIVAATLVDAGSGLTLDGYADDPALADLELLGAGHADLARAADALAVVGPTGRSGELIVDTGDGHHHVVRAVPDPHGDRLVLAVVVRGAGRHVARARDRLRQVSVAALTAGPTVARRPVDGAWLPEPAPAGTPGAPATDARDAAVEPARIPWTGSGVASVTSLSAMLPRTAPDDDPATAPTPRPPTSTISSVARAPSTPA